MYPILIVCIGLAAGIAAMAVHSGGGFGGVTLALFIGVLGALAGARLGAEFQLCGPGPCAGVAGAMVWALVLVGACVAAAMQRRKTAGAASHPSKRPDLP